jgi:predicted DCC family thiol-disulfide oxidoreductase YuxK
MARWVRRRDQAGRVQAIANQKAGALEHFGLSRAEADRAAWTIEPDGRRLEGAAAINRVLAEMPGVWPAIAKLYRARAVAAAQEALYRWFAKRRSRFHRLGVRPECDDPAAGCA